MSNKEDFGCNHEEISQFCTDCENYVYELLLEDTDEYCDKDHCFSEKCGQCCEDYKIGETEEG